MRLLAVLLAAVMVAAACGSDDKEPAAPSATTSAPAETTAAPAETTEAPAETTEAPTTTATPTTTTEPPPVGPQAGGEASVGLEAEAVGLRPWQDTCSSPCYNMMAAIFDKLVEQDESGSYAGWLATDYSSNDDYTVWTVNLREGVTFHDGTALTAQTVADMFPIQQAGAASSGAIAGSGLTSVEATGDLEVTYTLSATNSSFPYYLSRAPLGMVFDPATGADEDAIAAAANAPNGTGPFMVDSRDVDNETIVVRNPNYWMSDEFGTQLPYLDKITFRPIPDESTRLSSLTSGTVTAMQSLRLATIRDARAAGDSLWLFEFQGNNAGGGHFNTVVAPYDDLRVRRGLTLANNQDAVIAALGGEGISVGGTQYFSPDNAYWSQEVHDAYAHFDLAAGTAMLNEYVNDPERSDGKEVGEKIDVDLACPPDPTLIAAMSVLEQLWTATGLVNVNLSNFDQQTHINMALGMENGFEGTHGVHCWRFSSEDDPASILAQDFNTWQANPFNWSNWNNDEVMAMVAESLTTDDFDTRYALFEKIGLLINENVPIYWSGHTATVIATAAGLGGFDAWKLPDGSMGAGHPNAEGRWGQAYWSAD